EDAGRSGVTAGHQRGATRVGVRRVGGRRIRVLAAGVSQLGKGRARVVGDVQVEVILVHAIDRDQQHVVAVIALVVVVALVVLVTDEGGGGAGGGRAGRVRAASGQQGQGKQRSGLFVGHPSSPWSRGAMRVPQLIGDARVDLATFGRASSTGRDRR